MNRVVFNVFLCLFCDFCVSSQRRFTSAHKVTHSTLGCALQVPRTCKHSRRRNIKKEKTMNIHCNINKSNPRVVCRRSGEMAPSLRSPEA